MNKLKQVEEELKKEKHLVFSPGDTVKVYFKVREGNKEKIDNFEGICIGIRGSNVNQTFILHRILEGVSVEKIFPLHSPNITKIEVKKKGRVRKAKLYYLRGKKKLKVKSKRIEKLHREKTLEKE